MASAACSAPSASSALSGFDFVFSSLRLSVSAVILMVRASYTGSVPACHGSFRALLLYDIAEEFDVAELRKLLGSEPPARSPGFKLSDGVTL